MRTSEYQFILRASAAVLLLAISGCATLDREECLSVDWRGVGFEDGAKGYSSDRIGQHRKSCAQYGVIPDLSAYQNGRAEGLLEYCVPANGFRVGAEGGSYGGVCPSDLEPAFADAYRSGQQLYTLESRLSDVSIDLSARRRDLRSAESDLVKRQAVATSSEATADQRAKAVADVKQLGERLGRLKAEIRQLEEERVHCERDLEDYRATLNLP